MGCPSLLRSRKAAVKQSRSLGSRWQNAGNAWAVTKASAAAGPNRSRLEEKAGLADWVRAAANDRDVNRIVHRHSPGKLGQRVGNRVESWVLVFEMWDCTRRTDVSLAVRIRRRKARVNARSSSTGAEAPFDEGSRRKQVGRTGMCGDGLA